MIRSCSSILWLLPCIFTILRGCADLALLKNAKAGVEARNSVCHSAVIFANAIMHAGTTVDSFLRDNLDWLSRATNWAKFGATAGLGVIHRGHLSQVVYCSSCWYCIGSHVGAVGRHQQKMLVGAHDLFFLEALA